MKENPTQIRRLHFGLTRVGSILASVIMVLLVTGTQAAHSETVESDLISDNAFVVSEAYNQDPGVYQFVNIFQWVPRLGEWGNALSVEAPLFSLFHQLTLQTNFSHPSGLAIPVRWGDMQLSYQYYWSPHPRLQMTPRITLNIPFGTASEGTGQGGWGGALALAASIHLDPKLDLVLNYQSLLTPRALWDPGLGGTQPGLLTHDVQLGAGVLLNLVRQRLDLLAETQFTLDYQPDAAAQPVATQSWVASLGARALVYPFKEKSYYLAPGVSGTLTVRGAEVSPGVLFYLCFEGPAASSTNSSN